MVVVVVVVVIVLVVVVVAVVVVGRLLLNTVYCTVYNITNGALHHAVHGL